MPCQLNHPRSKVEITARVQIVIANYIWKSAVACLKVVTDFEVATVVVMYVASAIVVNSLSF